MGELTQQGIAENLRRAIQASGLTQSEVVARIDMDPTSLSKALAGNRKVSSLELALICSATGVDPMVILGADPIHAQSYRAGMQKVWLEARRAYEHGGIERYLDIDPSEDDYTGCGMEHDGLYCDLPWTHVPPTHHADLFWEEPDPRRAHSDAEEQEIRETATVSWTNRAEPAQATADQGEETDG